MYAVIETGGKQYRVTPGDVIDVERGPAVGDEGEVRFERVLMLGGDGDVEVGAPVVAGALVRASLVGEVRGPKIRVFKMKRRKGYRRTAGHRQDLLRLQIDGIDVGGETKAEAKPAAKAKAKPKAAAKSAKAEPATKSESKAKTAAAKKPAAKKPAAKTKAAKPAAKAKAAKPAAKAKPAKKDAPAKKAKPAAKTKAKAKSKPAGNEE
ncbi:MAG TPA: 50S ribosomal protein L21 [Thermoanaerobaculia bacterium]|nr:50S ribosomal protein L21 [Thermoanaerobaculia bacterium]